MRARALVYRSFSGVCLVAAAVLLASCKLNPTYKVGGIASGLTSGGLVLQNNGGDDLAISSNGPFTFSTALKKGKGYNVTVLTQPSGQNCTVANGTGTISRNVTDVRVDCVGGSFTVGGSVSGLSGAGLVLKNNGGNDLPISANGPFTFSAALASGTAYYVEVASQPSGQTCTVSNGMGSIAGANVTNVAVECAAPPAAPVPNLTFGLKELRFTWPAVSDAAYYRVLENPDGVSGFVQVATDLTAPSYNHTIPVHRRLNASYVIEACNVGGCTPSSSLAPGTNVSQAIGFVKASNTGAGDQLGMAVALSRDGNTLAVGAPGEDSGATVIDGNQIDECGLVPPSNCASNSGAVYVYTRGASGWVQQAYVKASNTLAGDAFGVAVALSGDGNTLAVGARSEDSAALDSGAVYIFTRAAGAWSQEAYVKASNPGAGDLFGSAVALSGDGNTLAVGAAFEDSDTSVIDSTPNDLASNAGAVYVFTRIAGAWSQQAYVKASNAGASDFFGNTVALSGDGNTLAVGAPGEDSSLAGVTAGTVAESVALNGASASGAVYIYSRDAGAWSQQAYVKASNTGAGDSFGMAVSLADDGNTLAVGATMEDSAGVNGNQVDDCGATAQNCASNSGAVYVYTRSAGAWSQQVYVKASNTGAGDQFGISVALSGDGSTLAVGAQFEDGSATGIGGTPDNLASDSGAVYVYAQGAGVWSQQAYVKASNVPSQRFGFSVALGADGNTLAVGTQFEDSATTGIGNPPGGFAADSGAAYLY